MHELSIVMNIIETAEQQVKQHNAHHVESIDLVIGELAGVDKHALDFAWEAAIKDTVLQNAERNIIQKEGLAKCLDCDCEFHVKEIYEPCPLCGQHLLHIIQGKELQIRSMVLN